jgi:hypothetical protein
VALFSPLVVTTFTGKSSAPSQTVADLGLYPEARRQFERTLDLRRHVLGAEDPKTIETMDRFAPMAQAEGNYADADMSSACLSRVSACWKLPSRYWTR